MNSFMRSTHSWESRLMTSTVPLDQVLEAGRKIVEGRIKGRVVVEIAP